MSAHGPTQSMGMATLTALADSLRTGTLPGGPRQQLEALGELGRRQKALGLSRAHVDTALRSVSAQQLVEALKSVDVPRLGSELNQSATEALELALSETAEEREVWLDSAWSLLLERDAAESILWAAEAWMAVHGTSLEVALHLRAALAQLDEGTRRRTWTRHWIALNDLRCQEQPLLDDEARARAWWLDERSQCAPFLGFLRGEAASPGSPDSQHLEHCPDCRRDVSLAAAVVDPGERHLGSEQLWSYLHHELLPVERRDLERHLARCADCEKARALLALEEPEAAEPAATRPDSPGTASPSEPRGTRRRDDEPRWVEETGAFRIGFAREAGRLRLRVARRSGALTAAAVFLENSPSPLPSKDAVDGWSFDLGPEAERIGQRLRVQLRVDGRTEQRELRIDRLD